MSATSQPAESSQDQVVMRRQTAAVWTVALRRQTAIWLCGTIASLAAGPMLEPAVSQAAILIAIASGLIAILPTVCGFLATILLPSNTEKDGPQSRFVRTAIAGMVVRVVGTVALFATCRYHLAASAETIAALTIGWYVTLAAVEFVALIQHSGRTIETLGGSSDSAGHQVMTHVQSESLS